MENNWKTILSAIIIGLSIGLISGFSISPVISQVLASLLGLLTILSPLYLQRNKSIFNSDKTTPYMVFIALVSMSILFGCLIGIYWRVEINIAHKDRLVLKDIEHRKQYISAQIELNQLYSKESLIPTINDDGDSIIGYSKVTVPNLLDVNVANSEDLNRAQVMTVYSKKTTSSAPVCTRISELLTDSIFFTIPEDRLMRELTNERDLYPLLPFINQYSQDTTELRSLLKSISRCFCE